MTTKKVLVPVDFSPQQDVVLQQAAVICKRLGAELVLVHCAAPPELSLVAVEPVYIPSTVMERFTLDHTAAVAKKMNEIAKGLRPEHTVEVVIKATGAVRGILAVADEMDCDYIVMGSHGAGLDRFLLGSVAESVTREATCPVIVARSEAASQFKRVVVGVDFSSFSLPLVQLAQALTLDEGEIHLVHTWQPPHLDTAHIFGDPGHESLIGTMGDGLKLHVLELQKCVSELPADARFKLHVETGRPAASLLAMVESLDADAIVVGAHDSDRIENFLGTVSDRILRHAGTTVLLTEQARAKRAGEKS